MKRRNKASEGGKPPNAAAPTVNTLNYSRELVRFGAWIDTRLEQLEARFQDFATESSLRAAKQSRFGQRRSSSNWECPEENSPELEA